MMPAILKIWKHKIEKNNEYKFISRRYGTGKLWIFTLVPIIQKVFTVMLHRILSHGCILEAMVLAFENRFETYSSGKGNITIDKMEEIYSLSLKHGINIAPFYNAKGLW